MSTPNKIYKYEPMSIQALTNLKSESIYFNSSCNFNDPFDCNMDLKVAPPNCDEVPSILTFLKEDVGANEAKLEELHKLTHDEVAAMGMVLADDYLKKRIGKIFESKGICCFSATNNNLLMWSHYASSGKGFCLEFDSSCEPFSAIQEVSYVDEPLSIDYKKVFSNDVLYLLSALFCTKSSHWSYEKEWRIFHAEVNKISQYPTSSLTGVYFGPEIDDDFSAIICLILQGQHPDIKFYQGFRAKDSYSVVFKEVKYTPHLINSV